MSYFHSVKLLDSECKGCTHCIRTCPTEAIRVRNGKATIITDRCIDCGECIRTCPNDAKIAVTDPLDEIHKFKYKIAIPAPSFVSQFSRRYTIEKVLAGFLFLGFDRVLEVGFGADLITSAIGEYLNSAGAQLPRPVISSACPAVVRLIQVRYPGLVGNIIPIQPPMEITARYVKEVTMRELGLPMSDIGVFFITPCPAKATAVKQPVGTSESHVNGVIAIRDMVNHIKMNFDRIQPGNTAIQSASSLGLGWGRRGGEIDCLEIPNRLAVDGIHQVSKVLEKIENGGFQNINFLEAQACVCGCVGGVLTAENPFIAKLKLDIVSKESGEGNKEEFEKARNAIPKDSYFLPNKIQPRPAITLGTDVREAMKTLQEIESICKELPGIDCGSCGCPTCRAFAEDVAAGLMMRMDCLFDLRERVRCLAGEIFSLAKKLPHVMQDKGGNDDT
ncbi:MAG: [Fe-Fe] hydrogenase large subunit C-terminal domain-containing protein [Syntrophales bacterium]|nr:[Fe-Fe] hydrogenase large subunit C-terminal domain-containing protein [Syntrophales bacterium]